MTVEIPSGAVDKKDDLLKPLQGLLQGINLLGKNTSNDSDKDPGAEVLEQNATAIAKVGAPIIAALGGLSAIGAAIGSFANTSDDTVRIAALGSAAGVLVAGIIGFSYIVSTDLKIRSAGAVAIYEVRKAITLEFLQEAYAASQATTAQASVGKEGTAAPLAPADAVIVLAAAGAKAQILRKADQRLGHLAGIRCDDRVSVKWVDSDGSEYWSDPTDINVVAYTY